MFTRRYPFLKNQRGLSLMELMIAITIGLGLLKGIYSIYLAHERTQQSIDALHHLQVQAKKIIDNLSDAILNAGQLNCGQLKNKLSGQNHDITLRYSAFPVAKILKSSHQRQILWITKLPFFKAGQTLVISDCQHAEFFQPEKVAVEQGMQKLTLSSPLQYEYASYAEVSHLVNKHYYLAKSPHTENSALYLQNNHQTMLLSEGVEAIRFYYSIREADHLIDVNADEIEDWTKVKAVKIELHLAQFPFKQIWYRYVRLTSGKEI